MIIKNAQVFGEDNRFARRDIYIKDEVIAEDKSEDKIDDKTEDKIEDKPEDKYILDATGLYAIPGLTDIHFHGCVGYDFCDGSQEAMNEIAKYQLKNGITTICPASMSLGDETLAGIFGAAAQYDNKDGAILCGINMEGPFIATIKKGAQNSKYIIKPDVDMFRQMQEKSGNLIKMVTIAPEIEGAENFIKELKDEVVLSIAHTNADYDTTLKALAIGASHLTHLYNAMPPFSHRAPGVIGAAFDTPDCRVELICDGIHVHPSVIRATFQMFGDDRIVLISDSMMATGMADGEYSLGGQEVKVSGKLATLVSDGAIAGSVTNLMDCIRNLVHVVGIPLESAVKCAAVNPVKAIRLFDQFGSITPGKLANIVLLDKELNIKYVILKGSILKDECFN